MPRAFLDTPHTIAIAGDWHARTPQARTALAGAAERGASHVVHTGDFGFRFAKEFLDGLESSLRRYNLVLGFVDGNHEDHTWLGSQPIAEDGLRYLRPRIVHLPRAYRWTWGDTTLMALGGAHSVDRQARTPGASWWEQETLTLGDAYHAVQGGPVDVMITHDCPAGVPVRGLAPAGTYPSAEIRRADEHRALLRQVCDSVRPRALWHGHYHARYDAPLLGGDYRTWVHGLGHEARDARDNVVVISSADLTSERPVEL